MSIDRDCSVANGREVGRLRDKLSAVMADARNAIHAYDTYVRMPSQGYNFRKEDAELAWLSALNQLRDVVNEQSTPT